MQTHFPKSSSARNRAHPMCTGERSRPFSKSREVSSKKRKLSALMLSIGENKRKNKTPSKGGEEDGVRRARSKEAEIAVYAKKAAMLSRDMRTKNIREMGSKKSREVKTENSTEVEREVGGERFGHDSHRLLRCGAERGTRARAVEVCDGEILLHPGHFVQRP